jgi:hypothetical protein
MGLFWFFSRNTANVALPPPEPQPVPVVIVSRREKVKRRAIKMARGVISKDLANRFIGKPRSQIEYDKKRAEDNAVLKSFEDLDREDYFERKRQIEYRKIREADYQKFRLERLAKKNARIEEEDDFERKRQIEYRKIREADYQKFILERLAKKNARIEEENSQKPFSR